MKKILLSIPYSANLSDLANIKYPNNLSLPQISQKEIFQTGKYLLINKVFGPDQIFNEVLKVIIPEISSHLDQILNNSLFIKYYLAYFKEFIIIILRRKRGKRDVTSLKSYEPISLLNILGKIITAVLVAKISYMAIMCNLLLKTHFEGRCRLCVETAIYYLIEKIYIA